MVLAPASSSVSARGSDQTHAASGGSAGMQPPAGSASSQSAAEPVLEWLEAANPLNLFPCLGPPQREFAGESLISREPAAEGSRRGVAPILSRQASSSLHQRQRQDDACFKRADSSPSAFQRTLSGASSKKSPPASRLDSIESFTRTTSANSGKTSPEGPLKPGAASLQIPKRPSNKKYVMPSDVVEGTVEWHEYQLKTNQIMKAQKDGAFFERQRNQIAEQEGDGQMRILRMMISVKNVAGGEEALEKCLAAYQEAGLPEDDFRAVMKEVALLRKELMKIKANKVKKLQEKNSKFAPPQYVQYTGEYITI
eukprot:Tamp_23868.p1 GENE.Tamp_23868~~Tamp_23868.p1  ORF type:complete len:311 (-),score=60.00 Tamp_23868:72-1004(-)